MIKLLAATVIVVTVTGCSVLEKGVSMIPSFWDDNQSAKIVDVRQAIEQISCEPGTQLSDSQRVLRELEWFELYSQSKGTRQNDVLRIIAPMQETARDWLKRSQTQEGSKAYCTSKRMILKQQSRRAAESILGRF